MSSSSAVLFVFFDSPPRQESFPLWRLDGLHNRRPRGCVEVCTKPHHCEKIHLLPGHWGHQRPSWIAWSSDGKERYSSHTSFITQCTSRRSLKIQGWWRFMQLWRVKGTTGTALSSESSSTLRTFAWQGLSAQWNPQCLAALIGPCFIAECCWVVEILGNHR